MSRILLIPLLILLTAFAPKMAMGGADDIAPAGGAQTDVDAEQVRQAIEKGVEYLERHEDLDKDFGHWPDYRDYIGSTTCLCTMALLYAGVPASEPHVQKAVNYLRTLRLDKTYTVSLQTMVFCLAEPKRDLLLIQRNAKWLEETQLRDAGSPHRGGWAYPGMGNGDNSNSQFALLALYEAERAGVPVQNETWRLALNYWKSAQNPDGSFGYYNLAGKVESPGSGSMTCAGIASLVIASGRISAGDAQADGDQIHCCGSQQGDDSAERVERALQWLGRPDVFTVQQNPHGQQSLWHLYFLYGVARIGRLTARRFIGAHDWYREGAALAGQPRRATTWRRLAGARQRRRSRARSKYRDQFCFAVPHQRAAADPNVEVQHGPADDWNRHRSDVANLTSYVESRWTKEFPLGLSWQVVDLSKATVDDLQQSPVLFMNGSQVPDIDDHQGQVLRDYIDRGGFLFAEACCADAEGFDHGFRALVKRIFPPEYQLKVLPPDHPIWHAEEIVPADQQRTLLGIDYGCRTSVVYCPPPKQGDPPGGLSCLWELSSGREQRFRPAVAAQVAAANSIGINVLAYATNRELKSKDENFHAKIDKTAEDDFTRGKLYVAKLRPSGRLRFSAPRRCPICWKPQRANCKFASALNSG